MAPKRRQCAAMQEYERLLEEQPSFRTNQRRAEEFTARAITSGEAEPGRPQADHDPDRGARGLQEAEGEHQPGPDPEPDHRTQQGLPGHEPRHLQGARTVEGPRRRPEDQVPARDEGSRRQADRRDRARADRPRVVRRRRRREAGRQGRLGRVAHRRLPQHLGVHARRRAARLRPVPRRPQGDRRRGDPEHRLRDRGHRGGTVQPGPHR